MASTNVRNWLEAREKVAALKQELRYQTHVERDSYEAMLQEHGLAHYSVEYRESKPEIYAAAMSPKRSR